MRGTDHYDEAERLLDTIGHLEHELDDANELTLRRAQVHADLAVAGALAACLAAANRGTAVVVRSAS